jgi:hypothetical protein
VDEGLPADLQSPGGRRSPESRCTPDLLSLCSPKRRWTAFSCPCYSEIKGANDKTARSYGRRSFFRLR